MLRSFTGYSVAAANNKAFGGGMFMAPDAELDDGKLDVVWVGHVAKLRFLANLPKVFKGRHVENDEVTVVRAAEVDDQRRPARSRSTRMAITWLICRRPIRVLPRALTVIAPPR